MTNTEFTKNPGSDLILPFNVQQDLEAEKSKKENHEEANKYLEHNKNINVIPEKYKTVLPVGSIIVKCFVVEPKYYSTLDTYLLPHLETYIKSPSGYNMVSITNPYPYSGKAVVIATDENSLFKKGELVQLDFNAFRPLPVEGTKNVDIPKKFLHYTDLYESVSLGDPEYGFLIINSRDILCRLNEKM